MTIVRRRTAVALGAVALVVSLAACGGQAASSAGSASTPSAATGDGAVAPVDPNAPEVSTAGDIPDNQVFVPYSPPGGSFRVSVPEGWARTADGAATVFTDKFNSVRVETLARPSAPDVASATADEVPTIASASTGFRPGEVSMVDRKAGTAVLITYTATSPADPVTGKTLTTAVERYEFWQGGQEVILTLAGPQGADNVDPWRTVSDSFGWAR